VSALLIIAIVAAVALVIYLGWLYEKKRRERMRALAAQYGWSYLSRDDSPLSDYRGDPFGSGSERKCKHVMRGSYHDRPSTVFEFEYVTYTTDSQGRRQKNTHRVMVTALGTPAALPWVQVTRENVIHKIGHALGFDDIELESEDFNRRYRVKAQDRKVAYDVLHPRMMELLLHTEGPAWRLENGALLTWSKGRLNAERVAPLLDFSATVIDNVPDFVWRPR
jgi:hypothetical protein